VRGKRVSISPAPQSPSPKSETTLSLGQNARQRCLPISIPGLFPFKVGKALGLCLLVTVTCEPISFVFLQKNTMSLYLSAIRLQYSLLSILISFSLQSKAASSLYWSILLLDAVWKTLVLTSMAWPYKHG